MDPIRSNQLTRSIKAEALRLGFHSVGITPASALEARRGNLAQWITAGFSGCLQYMETFFERQLRLQNSFQELKSIIVVAVSYAESSPQPSQPEPGAGRIAQYARGRDYHRAIEKRLKKLASFICTQISEPVRMVQTVDTHPVQERVLAEMAGLGFFGKNTCLIQPKGGSFSFLATLLTDLELIPDEPIRWDCGACTLCIEACPTQALVRPYELDARRCISYLTIEMKEAIDPPLRPLMQDWIFGCDICQQVCPYNRKATPSTWEEFRSTAGAGVHLSLEETLECRSQEDYVDRFAGTPLIRAKRIGLLRNAAIAAGNLQDPSLIPALSKTLMKDSSPLVRQHAAWALGKIGTPNALQSLREVEKTEIDPDVQSEIETALKL